MRRGLRPEDVASLTSEGERETLRRVAVRYLGEREGNAYADAATWEGVVLRLEPKEPGELRVWDFRDEFDAR